MDFQRLTKFFLTSIVLISQVAFGQELLKSDDVSKVMTQIFSQHVAKKEISADILKNSFHVYIDQFDPLRLYLLQSEVDPYLNLSDAQIQQLIAQYKSNDFSAFAKLNDVIQKAIYRARDLRIEVEKNKEALFAAPPTYGDADKADWIDPDLKSTFAKDTSELKHRIEKNIMSFIGGEKRRFGTERVEKKQQETLNLLNRYLAGQEDSYLYVDPHGKPLGNSQKENLFILHILKALASSLDAHTTFYDNTEAYDMKVRLEKAFEGIGVVLEQKGSGAVVIMKLIDGGPAAKSGKLSVSDQIKEIDGKSLKDASLNQVMEMIRGQNGSPISLKVQRGKDTFDVSLKREPISLKDDRVDVSYEQFGDGIIGKITLHAFYQGEKGITSENDLRQAIQELSKKGQLRGLILDLRDNSGGFLTQAVKVVGMFISNGVVVISKYSDGREHFYRDMEGREVFTGPFVVLVSRATASAAEIVAQALQDYGVAVVVGDEQTYGKGTIQSQTVTDEQAASYFKVTVGKYYTVSGKTPQIQGVKSDIVVPGPYSEERVGEKYLEYALTADTITPEYKDDLSDVDPALRPWYMRYYIPTLQPKIDEWRSLVPVLQKNSGYRIAHNKNYQAYLRQLKGLPPEKVDIADEELASKGKVEYVDDFQMDEAVNVVKDMVLLESRAHSIAETSTSSNAK